jgi:hypothetical protein
MRRAGALTDDERSPMRIPFACLVSLCAALALPTAAPAALGLGVVDDSPKGSLDGGEAFYALMADLGMTENRVTMTWDPSVDPATQDALVAPLLPAARFRGVNIVIAVYPAKARGITSSPSAPVEFAAYLQHLARTYPTVKDYIVGNEPNQTRFWQPQFRTAKAPRAARTRACSPPRTTHSRRSTREST